MNTEENYQKLQNTMNEYSDWVYRSAKAVLGFLDLKNKKVVDFGCGRGDWLKVASEKGANQLLGFDTYAQEYKELDIPNMRVDLTKPISLDQKFDVALCLEVGEHVEAAYSAILVDSIVRSAPVVLFSAAIPGQGGVHHVNEKPPIFWHELFNKHNYKCYDFRKEIWNNKDIQPWYKTSLLLYCAEGYVPKKLENYYTNSPLHLVHPDIFEAHAQTGKDIIFHYNKDLEKWYTEILS